MKIKIICLLFASLLFTGCSSIVNGGSKSVQFHSNPEGAKVTISNRVGREIAVETTPAVISLDRSSGYFKGEKYQLRFEYPGYYPYEARIESTVSGWYFGNVLFGGLIGLLIVDPATGDMFTLSPREVNCNFVSATNSWSPEEIKAAQLKANPIAPPKPPMKPKGVK